VALIDVLLLVDGSGSLGPDGFKAVKTASLRIANAMGGGVRMGALLFSGPTNTCQRKRCLGKKLGNNCRKLGWTKNSVVTPEDCGMNWVSRFSTDLHSGGGVADGLSKMEWPAQDSLISYALKSAQAELINSRRGVPKVVLLISDGQTYSNRHARKNARALKNDANARVVMIAVGEDAADNENLEKWVSWPKRDNFVAVNSYEDLVNDNITLNTAIQDFCTHFMV
jgi:hypothetical protein